MGLSWVGVMLNRDAQAVGSTGNAAGALGAARPRESTASAASEAQRRAWHYATQRNFAYMYGIVVVKPVAKRCAESSLGGVTGEAPFIT